MLTIASLPANKRKILEQHVEKIKGTTHMDTFKSMYAKMKLTFKEENVQIKRIDEEYCLETLKGLGWTKDTITVCTDDDLRRALVNSCSRYELIIRFPEIVVTNGSRSKITVRDLFVKLYAQPNGNLGPSLYGTVATFTKAQVIANYLHSHLGSQDVKRSAPGFGQFCLGDGEIVQVLTLLSRQYNEVNFAMLCIHIRNFVEWESLDGVPHIKMSSVPSLNNTPSPAPDLPVGVAAYKAKILIDLFRKLPLAEARAKVVLAADDTSILVEPTDELSIWAAALMHSYPQAFGATSDTILPFLAYKDARGKYLSCTATTGPDIRIASGTVLKFRGEEIKAKIIDNDSNSKGIKYANPKIIEQFCIKLSEELTSTALDHAETRSSDPSNHNGQVASTNPDPVQQDTPA